jgi:hypothetical protein
MSFIQPWMLWALPLVGLPIVIHLINQWRYQTRRWAPMMFLLEANRMNRGLARIRQWLILLLRTLALAFFIFGICRPLTSGFWNLFGTTQPDTTIVLLDRSPSMGDRGNATESKLEAGRQQLLSALSTLGSTHWAGGDTTSGQIREYPNLEALIDASSSRLSSAASQFPVVLEKTLEHLLINQSGTTDIWICSDLQATDWNPESGQWQLSRSGFQSLAQRVRFHLLAYPERPAENLSIRVTDATSQTVLEGSRAENYLVLSLQVNRTVDLPSGSNESNQKRTIPVELELAGAITQLQVELVGGRGEFREQRIALPSGVTAGWGRVSLPADSNLADNDFYFVFDSAPARRIVLVTDNPSESRPLQIAAGITSDGERAAAIDVLSPEGIGAMSLEGAGLLIWQAELPDATAANLIDAYIADGGQILFFPPTPLLSRNNLDNKTGSRGKSSGIRGEYRGVRWSEWVWPSGEPTGVTGWRSDQDLLAATQSGAGLPVGQLEIRGYGRLDSSQELTDLATLDGGDRLLSRLPTASGGIYFCTTGIAPAQSSLAQDGVVLFVLIQRAIEQGQRAVRQMRMREAGLAAAGSPVEGILSLEGDWTSGIPTMDTEWTRVAGSTDRAVPSTEFPFHAGVYRSGERLFAINRPLSEDQHDVLSAEQVDELFADLPLHRVQLQQGMAAGIVSEIWRQLLFVVLLVLLLEALLCLPKRSPVPSLAVTSFPMTKP